MLQEIEDLSSIACGFAWDLSARSLSAKEAEELWHKSLQEVLDSEGK